MGYKELQREKQKSLITDTDLFEHTKAGKRFRGEPRDFILQDGQYNLHKLIRKDVIRYFNNNNIQWWGGKKPSGHVLSSQIACINHLFPIRKEHNLLLKILNSASGIEFERLVAIPSWLDKEEDEPHFVAFEAISRTDHMNEVNLSRGANCTSVDALMIAENQEGRWLIPIEWKYTELYQNLDKSSEKTAREITRSECGVSHMHKAISSGEVRLLRYKDLIHASAQLKVKYPNYEGKIYFQEPYYQLMRQTLWSELSLVDYDARKFIHLHIVPSANKELLERRYKRFVEFDQGMVATWHSLLVNPNLYICKDPQEIFSAIEEFDSELYEYLLTRYWEE